MDTRYPAAVWRPLGPQTEPGITPRILVFHTMVGYLRSTDALFRGQGYTGTESHFGVGGPWDGPDLDGVVWQWQALDRQADAQGPGNAYATSVETSDGGHPEPWTDSHGVRHPANPWSARQLDALIRLAVWWCEQTGNPARLVTSTSDTGIGYHRQFSAWNPNAHSCPGDTRLKQLLDCVIPTAAVRLQRPHEIPTPHPEDDMPLTTADIDLLCTSRRFQQMITAAVWQVGWGIGPNGSGGTEDAATRLYKASHPEYAAEAVAAAVVAALPPAAGGGLTEAHVRAAVAAVLTEGTARA